MSATNALKLALLADANTIAGIGDVDKVSKRPENIDVSTGGAIGIFASSGASELDSFNDRDGIAQQEFEVLLYVRSDTDPNTESDTLIDAFRNAIEDTASAIGAVSGSGVVRVEQSTVSEWGPVEVPEDIAEGWYVRTAKVSITYYYERGSV